MRAGGNHSRLTMDLFLELSLLTAALVVIGYAIMFGDPERGDLAGRLNLFLTEWLPRGLTVVVERTCGVRAAGALHRVYHWMFWERNPLLQVRTKTM